MNEHKQTYYSHITGISFDGSNDNKFKLNQLYDNNNNNYNPLQSQSPIPPTLNNGGPMKLKINDNIGNDNHDNNINIIGLFPIPRLKVLYNIVNRVFIDNSIAQYIRDIIIAIRLHPDVRNVM